MTNTYCNNLSCLIEVHFIKDITILVSTGFKDGMPSMSVVTWTYDDMEKLVAVGKLHGKTLLYL